MAPVRVCPDAREGIVICEIELPPELAMLLNRLAESAATRDLVGVAAHPELRRQTRNRLVAEAVACWLSDAAVFESERGLLRLAPRRPRPIV